jgi:hypothetical protein
VETTQFDTEQPAVVWKVDGNGVHLQRRLHDETGGDGQLGVARVVPWDDVTPGYGRHQVEYRAIDASGNIGTPNSFAVTLLRPAPTCTKTITGTLNSPLLLGSGVTCLVGASVNGSVTVNPGAALVATDSLIKGPVTATNSADLHLLRTTVGGPVKLDHATRSAVLVGSTLSGPVTVLAAHTTDARLATVGP